VRLATQADVEEWAALRTALWPGGSTDSHAAEIRGALMQSGDKACFLAIDADAHVQGFAEATLRRDYVNGTESSPVGFLEGWYVTLQARGCGAGRALVVAVEQWAGRHGCSELASDALLDNEASHRAHAACGFEETERVVYFRKWLD
jgi:aminoglycoside 6'-N-acetyltransferase I